MNQSEGSVGQLVNDAIIKDIRDSIVDLEYGEILVKVHNGRIVQMDVTRRSRFDQTWKIEGGGGI